MARKTDFGMRSSVTPSALVHFVEWVDQGPIRCIEGSARSRPEESPASEYRRDMYPKESIIGDSHGQEEGGIFVD
jgi:hypothetical protein